MNVIIYKTDEGNVAVLTPTNSSLRENTIHQIAQKDVPTGKPYKIIQPQDLPKDNSLFEAWEVDETKLTNDLNDDVNLITINVDKASKIKQASVREKRNNILSETDWTASSDLKMSDEMKAYRQALRDVPAQENFPDVTWPEFIGEPLAPVEEEAEEETEETTEEPTEETTEKTTEETTAETKESE